MPSDGINVVQPPKRCANSRSVLANFDFSIGFPSLYDNGNKISTRILFGLNFKSDS